MTALVRGANTVLGPAGEGGLPALMLGLAWDAGALDCDACALVCGPDRKVVDDEHFLFWNNRVTPGREVFLRVRPAGPAGDGDRAQVLVDLTDLPPQAERIVVTLATVVEGATLAPLRRMRVRAVDPRTGMELAAYEMGREVTVESCLIAVEVYRHRGDWKMRAVGQGYATGLAGLGTDYGVAIVE